MVTAKPFSILNLTLEKSFGDFQHRGSVPSIKKTILFILSALVGASVSAENTFELGSDTRGNLWKIASNQAQLDKDTPTPYLQVEFPRPLHFRSHHQIKTALISIRLLCSQRDVAIDHIRLHDEDGAEIANLPASDPAQMYAHLLPETIKDSVFAHSCAVKHSALARDNSAD